MKSTTERSSMAQFQGDCLDIMLRQDLYQWLLRFMRYGQSWVYHEKVHP